MANRWSILVDLMSRVLMVVVLTAVDSWRGRIDDLKLRWQPTIAALFRPNGAEKTLKPAGVLLVMRIATFLWWFGSFRWPEMGDRKRERERRRREERGSLRSATVWTRAWCNGAVEGCEPLIAVELTLRLWLAGSAGDRTVRMIKVFIWCDAAHWKLGTPDDVAQRDQNLDYFKGWDVSGF
jgi:hypothetical protein